MVRNRNKLINKVICLIKQLIHDFIIAQSFVWYIFKIPNGSKSDIGQRTRSLLAFDSPADNKTNTVHIGSTQ